jgi:tight adherence protein B
MGIGTIFIIILILSFAVIVLTMRPTKSEEAVQQRLRMIEGIASGNVELPPDLLKRETLSEIPQLDALLHQFPAFTRLHHFIAQADSQRSVGEFVTMSLVLGVGGAWVSNIWLPAPGMALLVGVALASLPFFYLSVLRARRFRHFEELLPEAIDLMSRALRAGHAISSAIEMVSEESSDPIASEFRRVFEEQNFGLPLREGMLNLTDRVPLPDVRFLVTAILVQKETGGNLAEVLDKTAAVIRDRFRLRGQLRVYTAQGRLTGWILAALPFGLFLALRILSPSYASILITDPVGRELIYAGLAMMAAGAYVIRRIINIEV